MHHLLRYKKLGLLAIIPLILCCEDKISDDLRRNVGVASEILLGQTIFLNTYLFVDQLARDSALWSQGSIYMDSAEVIVLQPDRSFLINYGDSNVLCNDGFYRRGKVEATFPTSYLGDTLNLTIKFLDHYLNDRKIDGQILVVSSAVAFQNNWWLHFSVAGGSIQGNPRDILWEADLALNWFEGMESPGLLLDDKAYFDESGTITGISSDGATFNAKIVLPIYLERTCLWPTSGQLDLDIPSLFVRFGYIDFGTGDCDARVSLVFNGNPLCFYMD